MIDKKEEKPMKKPDYIIYILFAIPFIMGLFLTGIVPEIWIDIISSVCALLIFIIACINEKSNKPLFIVFLALAILAVYRIITLLV